jgi:hypothetical protein
MGSPVKRAEDLLTCEQVRQWHQHGRLDQLSPADLLAVERHCEQCAECWSFLYGSENQGSAESLPASPEPPLYLAAQIKCEVRQRRPAQRASVRKRLIGSPHFLAVCAVIVAGAVATLGVIYYFNSLKPREDAWAPAFVLTSGGGTIMLADSEDPSRAVSTEEMLERFQQGKEALEGRGGEGGSTETGHPIADTVAQVTGDSVPHPQSVP